MRSIKIITIALLAVSTAHGTEQSMLAKLEQEVAAGRVQSAAIAIYENDEARFLGLGQLSRDNSAPPQRNTLYEIGSISKVFTALMALELIHNDQLALDTTLGEHFDDVEFDSDLVAAITIRELLTHRSGLKRMPDNFQPADQLNPYVDYSRGDLLDYLTDINRIGRKEYAYSNLGMGTAGTIVADRLSLTYGTALRVLIAGPLGMTDTVTKPNDEQLTRLAAGHSGGAKVPGWGF